MTTRFLTLLSYGLSNQVPRQKDSLIETIPIFELLQVLMRVDKQTSTYDLYSRCFVINGRWVLGPFIAHEALNRSRLALLRLSENNLSILSQRSLPRLALRRDTIMMQDGTPALITLLQEMFPGK